ncbi:hypothetical protein H0G86_003294 [Trichoderma simmonsii]|uniref:Uncharacterized protein n=1 Tax=Trichoderma simmonsii TaxID=1491479 RepID=A0A8G0PEA2_9HYPO|nr:hypothetical protein H0G86_003294 [Trichoderma simmonsii]
MGKHSIFHATLSSFLSASKSPPRPGIIAREQIPTNPLGSGSSPLINHYRSGPVTSTSPAGFAIAGSLSAVARLCTATLLPVSASQVLALLLTRQPSCCPFPFPGLTTGY